MEARWVELEELQRIRRGAKATLQCSETAPAEPPLKWLKARTQSGCRHLVVEQDGALQLYATIREGGEILWLVLVVPSVEAAQAGAKLIRTERGWRARGKVERDEVKAIVGQLAKDPADEQGWLVWRGR